MARLYERDYRDYVIDLGDTVQFRVDGVTMQGKVVGCGFARSYLKVRGFDGNLYEMYSSDEDVRKVFDDE